MIYAVVPCPRLVKSFHGFSVVFHPVGNTSLKRVQGLSANPFQLTKLKKRSYRMTSPAPKLLSEEEDNVL